MSIIRTLRTLVAALAIWQPADMPAAIEPGTAALFLDFEQEPGVRLWHGAKVREGRYGKAIGFTTAMQYAEVDFSEKLDGIEAMSVGGWFFPWRTGEQYFLFRGIPEIEERGNRMFRRQETWVNFVLGTDQHGFLIGTINGNGTMPFPHVTVNEVAFDAWHQLVVVKDARGVHR